MPFVLAEKKALAARRYQSLLDRVGNFQREEVLRAIEMRFASRVDGVDRAFHACPVCNRTGILGRYVTESDLNFTGASYPNDPPRGERYAYPEEFVCFVCGLELDEAELGIEPAFDDVLEEEVEPSDEFERALEDWAYEERAEQAREEMREEERRNFDF